jgi:hypothetical protein
VGERGELFVGNLIEAADVAAVLRLSCASQT